METWATFSIIDHRAPVYRQALALFDRIVVPVPREPIGDQKPEELTQLEAEVSYLAAHHAAELHEWKSDAFAEWRRPILAEAIADTFNRDAYADTRMMLAETFSSKDVQAIPVYNGNDHYARSRQQLNQPEQALTIEILQRLPVPDYDTPLENLIKLREAPAFRTALDDMLEWKRQKLPAILLAEDRLEAIASAMREFDKHTKAYSAVMESEGYKKAGSVASIFFAAIRGDVLGAVKEGLVGFRELHEPSWKKISAMKCAPGGVVYHFKEAVH
jgi:hypothetical protein